MTEIDPPLEMPPAKKRCCWKKKIAGVIIILAVIAAAMAVLPFCPWFIRMHSGQESQDLMRIEQQVSALENRVHTLDERMNELGTQNPSPLIAANTKQPATVPQSAAEMAHLQSDMVALSSALSALQMEVKQTGTHAMQAQQTTQTSLAAAIAFIELREAAMAGIGFAPQLTSMREASKNDAGFQEPLAKLEPFAPKGAPTIAALHEELLTLEASADQAVEKDNAQNWWQRLLVEIKGLVSVRPIHGEGAPDVFAAMEDDLTKGEAGAAVTDMKNLPPEGQQILGEWRTKAEGRQIIDDQLHAIADRFTTLANPPTAGAP